MGCEHYDFPYFDRILLSSKYNPDNPQGCSGDGYSGSWNEVTSKPVTYSLPTAKVQGITIKDAFLQIFKDAFQAPNLCTKFQITLNGKRFAEGEKFINAIDQTNPVGKLIFIPVPEEFYADISGKSNQTFYQCKWVRKGSNPKPYFKYHFRCYIYVCKSFLLGHYYRLYMQWCYRLQELLLSSTEV